MCKLFVFLLIFFFFFATNVIVICGDESSCEVYYQTL